jgi:hypothetical protein
VDQRCCWSTYKLTLRAGVRMTPYPPAQTVVGLFGEGELGSVYTHWLQDGCSATRPGAEPVPQEASRQSRGPSGRHSTDR